ncbi:NAD(+)--arginine ADP-ribosyltransferase EFV [uncultured Clostridium sp.]|nr:NAD(+)--arginine ADP-ribosyltransferase EFV [uncultured Clostridium sp.]SCJ49968.1 NAD(+)--arginine ADP-ribosyltransferase EFV [uncultured Clostridium sp.]
MVIIMNDLLKKLSIEANEKSFNYNFDETYDEQRETLKKVLNVLGSILLIYTIKNEFLILKSKEKNKIKEKLYAEISISFEKQIDIENKLISDALFKNTQDNYYRKLFVLSLGTKINVKKINDSKINDIVNDVVEGETWSERLLKNKNALKIVLKKDIKNFLDGYISVNEIKNKIESRFNTNAYESKRLVESEIARCQSNVNDYVAEKYDIRKQLFMATLDNKTSKKCRNFDGKIFDVDDPNKPMPPLHPFCRSCLVNIPNENWRPERRYDNITKTDIIWKKYKQWYDSNIK